jgi:hypothetical protein
MQISDFGFGICDMFDISICNLQSAIIFASLIHVPTFLAHIKLVCILSYDLTVTGMPATIQTTLFAHLATA